MEHICICRIGDVVIDLYKSVNGYYGTIFAETYFWKFDSLKDTIHNEYEIAEIADAILRASWWAEEVVELEGLPDWCYEISID